MWRSDCESRILNTYVPAGNPPHPLRWTPGISTGPLKVITVLLFHSSAFAPGENTTPASARQNTVDTAVFKTLICFFSFDLDTCAAGPSLCRAPCLQDSAGWQHTMDKKHSKVHRHITMRRARLLCRSGPCLPYLEGNGAQRQS